MEETYIQQAAAHYGHGNPEVNRMSGTAGLELFSCQYPGDEQTLLLHVHHQVDKIRAERYYATYALLYQTLLSEAGLRLPAPVASLKGEWFVLDEGHRFFFATESIPGAFCLEQYPDSATAFEAADCIARYSVALGPITESIDHFEALNAEGLFDRFEQVITTASIMRLLRATHVISELRQRKTMLNTVSRHVRQGNLSRCPVQPMVTPGNILLEKKTGRAIVPMAMECATPGYHYQNFGSLIRSGVCAVDENSTAWEAISVRPAYYEAMLLGYLRGANGALLEEEKRNIHQGALLITYLRSLQLVTDFLENDLNIATEYPEQNLNRALNQFILLEQLENYLLENYGVNIYEAGK